MDLEEDSVDEHLERILADTKVTIAVKMSEGRPYNYDERDYLAIKDELQHRDSRLEKVREEVETMQPALNALLGYAKPPKPKFRRIA